MKEVKGFIKKRKEKEGEIMAGGTFTVQNKVRPGAYINFKSAGKPLGTLSDRGIMTMPLSLKWGPSKKVIEITNETDIEEVLGYSLLDQELLLIKEAVKRASKILLYRVNDGTKATATVEPLTITARYGGTRGNAIVSDIDRRCGCRGYIQGRNPFRWSSCT